MRGAAAPLMGARPVHCVASMASKCRGGRTCAGRDLRPALDRGARMSRRDAPLHGLTVVVDTHGNRLYIGRYNSEDGEGVLLRDVDVRDLEDGTTRLGRAISRGRTSTGCSRTTLTPASSARTSRPSGGYRRSPRAVRSERLSARSNKGPGVHPGHKFGGAEGGT